MRPASVEAVRVAAGEKGSLSATVSFEAPAISTAGTAIEMLSKVEVKRDGEVIETRENVPAGETVTVEDTAVETAGMHTYSVVTYLGEEASDGASVPTEPQKLLLSMPGLMKSPCSATPTKWWLLPTVSAANLLFPMALCSVAPLLFPTLPI